MRFIGMGVSMFAVLVLELEVVCGRPRDSAIEEVVDVLVDPEPGRSRLCAWAGSEKNDSLFGSTPPPIFGPSSDIKPNALLNSARREGIGMRYVKKESKINYTLSFFPPLIICRTHMILFLHIIRIVTVLLLMPMPMV